MHVLARDGHHHSEVRQCHRSRLETCISRNYLFQKRTSRHTTKLASIQDCLYSVHYLLPLSDWYGCWSGHPLSISRLYIVDSTSRTGYCFEQRISNDGPCGVCGDEIVSLIQADELLSLQPLDIRSTQHPMLTNFSTSPNDVTFVSDLVHRGTGFDYNYPVRIETGSFQTSEGAFPAARITFASDSLAEGGIHPVSFKALCWTEDTRADMGETSRELLASLDRRAEAEGRCLSCTLASTMPALGFIWQIKDHDARFTPLKTQGGQTKPLSVPCHHNSLDVCRGEYLNDDGSCSHTVKAVHADGTLLATHTNSAKSSWQILIMTEDCLLCRLQVSDGKRLVCDRRTMTVQQPNAYPGATILAHQPQSVVFSEIVPFSTMW